MGDTHSKKLEVLVHRMSSDIALKGQRGHKISI